MRAVIQRVTEATCRVDGQVTGAIRQGLVVLLGVAPSDTIEVADWMADKICRLRVFSDDDGKMRYSVQDVGGSLLVISQFTLYGDIRRGNRPDFKAAAPREVAEPLYEHFIFACRQHRVTVATGVFGAHMDIQLVNSGPVTMQIDSNEVMWGDSPRISTAQGHA
ncbi:hypothetical protein TPY_3371 [Sulfobacillus acidophilus TPY]|uniref:D-aminoacyl-tRNA deacylase n=1 Tax=Sulfobacillus acidophilus (strain ATCC 700253 / DSM 10332 / NAL) TaxID=679936 RepID=G8TXT4_SULAD|nr:hypothetical protein TPY_3371 [Sulfobacillus acidophilus TPY]AEW05040.1 D-tyrosyl-tRNA(Tyr) deacylase [Sulfobacillus acidophilus DSM 10332]